MSNHAANDVPDVRNTDLHWDGTALGLQPRIVKPETLQRVGDRTKTDDQLVELLLDPDRFAAAHVVLTMRRNALTSFDASQWNGLRVVLGPAGTARYERDDMATLHERWSTAVRSTAR